ncbi:MAG: 4-hydroxy-3-methylbut-2-enyl diphosphate reductase, partial [Actinobacteria bacterium]|nr:4-hydroxy-3-methylbut-2-enyl diphosphate reductase [Actinomycetota bacterium]
PQVVQQAITKGSYVVDSVCPLVTKVHHEVKTRASKGFHIVYIGHDGHEEAVGTMAVAPDSITRVETLAEVDALKDFVQPVAILAQTTLSHRDWEDVADAVKVKFPKVWSPGKSDLCFATTNRQGALMKIAEQCDAIVVIGSDNSSNTRALEKLAREVGCKNVYRINNVTELPNELSGVVGITAGASAPEELVLQIIEALAPRLGVDEVSIAQEDEYFPPPRHIRQLQSAIETVVTVMLGGSLARQKIVDDRKLAASTVLALLAG